MIHWRTQTSESVEFCSDGPGLEIYQMFSPSDAALMLDSVFPADDRLTFPDAGPESVVDQGQPFEGTGEDPMT